MARCLALAACLYWYNLDILMAVVSFACGVVIIKTY